MSAQLEPFEDSASARAALVPILISQFQGEGSCNEAQWLKRMAYWWDENPFASAHPCRGWVLRDAGQIVGYLGVIPTFYEDTVGKPIPALIATTWAIAKEHRNAALAMGLMLQRQSNSALLVDTTPSPEVQTLLHRWDWTSRTQIRRSLIIRGISLAGLTGLINSNGLTLPNGREITTDLCRVHSIDSTRPQKFLQKHVTPDYLRWFAASPMREHHFIGIVNAQDSLSSYLMLSPKFVKGLSSWTVVDWFTTQETNRELLVMVDHLIRKSPAIHGKWWPFISLAAFLPEDPWAGVSYAYQREEAVNHFYSLPPEFKGQNIRSVMAEGDWGL